MVISVSNDQNEIQNYRQFKTVVFNHTQKIVVKMRLKCLCRLCAL